MNHLLCKLILPISLFFLTYCQAQTIQENQESESDYYKIKTASKDGIGKYYLGREISYVMGHPAAAWLERNEREEEEKPSLALKEIKSVLALQEPMIADIGAGSGYYSFLLASTFPQGRIYAVDIQPEMLALITEKQKKSKITNIETILGTEANPKLPEGKLDLVIMVDVYHELAYPYEMMLNIFKSLKKGGKIILLEFKAEDENVPIKTLHKMTEKQARKEMEFVGLKFIENKNLLPWQHFLVFEKP